MSIVVAPDAGGKDFGAFSFPPCTPRMLYGLLAAYPALFLAFLVLPPQHWLLVGVAAAVIELVCWPTWSLTWA